MAPKIKRAPSRLDKEGRKFWKQVLKDFDLTDGHHLKILENACQCLDRIQEAQSEIETRGSFFLDRWGMPKEHPAHSTERNNKTLFSRLLRELSLDLNVHEDSRPPGKY